MAVSENTCYEVVNIDWLKSLVGSAVQDADGNTVSVDEKSGTTYCPTYKELTNDTFIPYRIESSGGPASDTDGITVNKKCYATGEDYADNQLVNKHDVAVCNTRLKTFTIDIAGASTNISGCSGGTKNLSYTRTFTRNTWDMLSCSTQTESSHSSTDVDDTRDSLVTWSTNVGSISNNKLTVGKNTPSTSGGSSSRTITVTGSSTFRGTPSTPTASVTQNGVSGSVENWYTGETSQSDYKIVPSQSTFPCTGGSFTVTASHVYKTRQYKHWVDECGVAYNSAGFTGYSDSTTSTTKTDETYSGSFSDITLTSTGNITSSFTHTWSSTNYSSTTVTQKCAVRPTDCASETGTSVQQTATVECAGGDVPFSGVSVPVTSRTINQYNECVSSTTTTTRSTTVTVPCYTGSTAHDITGITNNISYKITQNSGTCTCAQKTEYTYGTGSVTSAATCAGGSIELKATNIPYTAVTDNGDGTSATTYGVTAGTATVTIAQCTDAAGCTTNPTDPVNASPHGKFTYKVTQTGCSYVCTCSDFTLTESSLSFVADGGAKTIGTIANDCSATCSGVDWITIGKNGTSVNLTASENASQSSRSGTVKISVGGTECTSVTVSQDAAVADCPSQSDVLVGFASTIGKDGGYSVQIGRFKNNVAEFEATSITISEGSEYASIVGTGTTWPDDSSWNVIQVSFQPNTSTSTRDIKIKLEGIRSTDICDDYELKITQSAWDGCPSFSDVVSNGKGNPPSPITEVTVAGGVGCETGCNGFLWFKTGDTAFSSTGSVTPDGTVVTGASFGGQTQPGWEQIALKFKANNTDTDKNGSVIIKMNNTAGGECSYTVPVTLKAVSVPGGVITYYSPTKLNVTLNDFTPAATAETFSNGVGKIEFDSAPTGIGNKAFSGKTAMTGIDIPDSITSIGNSAFTQCTSLTAITIPHEVIYINDYLLYGCTSLSSVTIQRSWVDIKQYAIANCPGLRKIELPNAMAYPYTDVTSLYNTADCPIYVPEEKLVYFWGASTFPYVDRVIAHISYHSVVYKSVSKLTGDTLGNAYAGETDATTKLSILSHTYDSSKQIGKITYNKPVGSFHKGTFDSKPIQYIILPENIKRIGQEVFQSCTSLRSIYFPDSVVGLCNSPTDHGSAAFNNCLALKTVVAGSGLTQIGESCFNIGGDATVTGFTFYSTTPPTLYHENSFEHVGNSKIYVPCGQLSTYKSADIWGNKPNITNRIEPIPLCTS